MAVDWTDEQNDAIVADYFAMLADDIVGWPYSKTERNRMLQALSRAAARLNRIQIQNISAVLQGLGEAWISGY